MYDDDDQYDLNHKAAFVIFILVTIMLICGLVCSSCVPDKEIQVERRLVTVVKVREIYRFGAWASEITWEDRARLRYVEFGEWPTGFKEGYRMYILITR